MPPPHVWRYDLPWLIIRLADNLYALEISNVREMIQMVKLSPVPEAPDYVRGVTTLRDRSLVVLDLRKRLGMRGVDHEMHELIEILEAREQDHVHWLEELESCAREGREFTLARDPAECAFGRWYAGFHTDNLTLRAHLRRFDAPHRAIHALADDIMALAERGNVDGAIQAIAGARLTTLRTMRALFAQGISLLQETSSETLVILEAGDALVGLSTDRVEAVEYLAPDSIQDIGLPDAAWLRGDRLVHSTARTARSERLVMVLDTKLLLAEMPDEALRG